jgi:hypothetical protein
VAGVSADTTYSKSLTSLTFLSGGIVNVDLQKINDQLKRFHDHDGVGNFITLGLDGNLKYKKYVLGISLQYGFSSIKSVQKELDIGMEQNLPVTRFTFNSFSSSFEFGFSPFKNNKNLFYPYIGIRWDYLIIKTNNNYMIRAWDCFFNGKNKYSVNGLGILIGVLYGKSIYIRDTWPYNIILGIETNVGIPILSSDWKVNGKTVNYPHNEYEPDIPKFKPIIFLLKLKLGIPITNASK